MEEARGKMRLLLAVTAAFVLLFAACGDDDDDGATPTPEPTATEEATGTPGPAGETATPTVAPADSRAGMALAEWSVRPGKTRPCLGRAAFHVRNEGTVPHQF